MQWSPDGSQVAFVSTSRDHKDETLRVADAATGAVRDVLDEQRRRSSSRGNGGINWRCLPAIERGDLVLGARQLGPPLSLRPAATGALKQQITTGEGNVTQLLRVDEKKRMLYFPAWAARRAATRTSATSTASASTARTWRCSRPRTPTTTSRSRPSGEFFVDSYSRPDVPPVVACCATRRARSCCALEKADISRLLAAGWKPPTPITVKARDGVTDLYGLMYRPTNFDPAKKYPIINHIYPGPADRQRGRAQLLRRARRPQALAELGFVVVEIDGMGTPWRSKKFHDAYYGDMGDNTLPDQVAGMKELAQRYPWIDIDRAGIWGHSGGGFATAAAMFRYPTSSRWASRRRATTTTACTRTTGARSGRGCS